MSSIGTLVERIPVRILFFKSLTTLPAKYRTPRLADYGYVYGFENVFSPFCENVFLVAEPGSLLCLGGSLAVFPQ